MKEKRHLYCSTPISSEKNRYDYHSTWFEYPSTTPYLLYVYSILTRLLNSFSTATVNLGCSIYFGNIWVFRHYCTYQWYDPINRWFNKKTKKISKEDKDSILRSNPERRSDQKTIFHMVSLCGFLSKWCYTGSILSTSWIWWWLGKLVWMLVCICKGKGLLVEHYMMGSNIERSIRNCNSRFV